MICRQIDVSQKFFVVRICPLMFFFQRFLRILEIPLLRCRQKRQVTKLRGGDRRCALTLLHLLKKKQYFFTCFKAECWLTTDTHWLLLFLSLSNRQHFIFRFLPIHIFAFLGTDQNLYLFIAYQKISIYSNWPLAIKGYFHKTMRLDICT